MNVNGFRHYGKVHRLGKEEVEGILEGTCYIQEKVDGANTSIWLDEAGNLKMGSRTRILGEEEFNGFVPYVEKHNGIVNLLVDHPTYRLYGEWLVRHTIAYKETAYRKWYMFDIFDGTNYLTTEEVNAVGEKYSIDVVPFLAKVENPTHESLQTYMGASAFGDRGEGIVVKNYEFINGFGDREFAKLVTESFKEDNGITFGGNNKHSDTYFEMYVVNKYMTLTRVKKIMDKLQPELNERLDMKHIPRIINTAYHDMLVEEIWSIQADVKTLDFQALKRVACKKAKQIYVDLLSGDVSVADLK